MSYGYCIYPNKHPKCLNNQKECCTLDLQKMEFESYPSKDFKCELAKMKILVSLPNIKMSRNTVSLLHVLYFFSLSDEELIHCQRSFLYLLSFFCNGTFCNGMYINHTKFFPSDNFSWRYIFFQFQKQELECKIP